MSIINQIYQFVAENKVWVIGVIFYLLHMPYFLKIVNQQSKRKYEQKENL